ncbi:MAG: TolC family protein [Candidatus Binataceae bacterium]
MITEALRQSHLIAAARAKWLAQSKSPMQAATLPDPQITVQNMAVGNAIPGNRLQTSNFAYFGYGVTQKIPYPGKLELRAAVKQKDAEAARQDYLARQRQVVEQVRETYFNLFYLSRALHVLQRTHGDFESLAHITESQYEVGTAQQQDVLKAQLEMTKVLKQIEVTREEFGQAQDNLKAILGREQDSPEIPIGDVRLTPFKLDTRELRKLALHDSPELRKAHKLEAASEESLKLADEGYIPDLTFSYMYQKTGERFPDYYMATIGVSIPLYFWRKQTPAVEQAGLNRESAQARTYATRLSVFSRVQNQLLAIQTDARLAQVYSQGLIPQAEATLRSAMGTYRVGKIDFQTLLSAEIDVLTLKQQYFRTIADHEIAIARIQQITGLP